MKQRVGFARALAVEPEILFMDEPFSALDVLTAENLRGELLELWLGKKIPTRSIFLVTHNIEEAVLLADRIIVLGRNPAQDPRRFPRSPGAAARAQLRRVPAVRGLHLQADDPAASSKPPPVRRPRGQGAATRCCRMRGRGAIAGLLELLERSRRQGGPVPHRRRAAHGSGRPAAHRGSRRLLGFAKSDKGDVEITPEGKAFAEADISTPEAPVPRRRAGARHPAAADDERAGQQVGPHHAARVLPRHAGRAFLRREVKRQIETALNWGRYADMFTYDSDKRQAVAATTPATTGRTH